METLRVVRRQPSERCELEVFVRFLRACACEAAGLFGLVTLVHRLGERVVAAVSDGSDRRCCADLGESFTSEARRPLNESPDRSPVRRTGDQITLPLPEDRPFPDPGWSFADVDHVGDPAATLRDRATGSADRFACAQPLMLVTCMSNSALDLESPIDRFAGHRYWGSWTATPARVRPWTGDDRLGGLLQLSTFPPREGLRCLHAARTSTEDEPVLA